MTSDKIICLEAGGREELLYLFFFSPGVHRAAHKAAPFLLRRTQPAWPSEEEGTDPSEKERKPARCLQLLCNDTHYRASLNKHPGNGLQSTTVSSTSVRGGGEGAALGFAERLHLTSAHLVEASPVAARRQILGFYFTRHPPTHTHTPTHSPSGAVDARSPYLSLQPFYLLFFFFQSPERVQLG